MRDEADNDDDAGPTQEPETAATDFSHLVAGKKPADVVAAYIVMRDKKRVADETYSTWLKEQFTSPMRFLENWLLDQLNTQGLDSIAAQSGTAYKKRTTSVTVADSREFRRHVIGSEQWDLADWRANKTAVEELVEKGEGLPPGVNYSSFYTVGIRRK